LKKWNIKLFVVAGGSDIATLILRHSFTTKNPSPNSKEEL
jgi:hypothetical protein